MVRAVYVPWSACMRARGGDGKPLCHPMVGTRCHLSPSWTSSQFLAPVLSRVIRLPAKGPLSVTALCRDAGLQQREGSRCAEISCMKLSSHVQHLEISCWLPGLRLSVLGREVGSDLGPVTFLLRHANEVSHGRTVGPFLITLKKPFSCLTFLYGGSYQREVASYSQLKLKWRGVESKCIEYGWRSVCDLCLKDLSEQLNFWVISFV